MKGTSGRRVEDADTDADGARASGAEEERGKRCGGGIVDVEEDEDQTEAEGASASARMRSRSSSGRSVSWIGMVIMSNESLCSSARSSIVRRDISLGMLRVQVSLRDGRMTPRYAP